MGVSFARSCGSLTENSSGLMCQRIFGSQIDKCEVRVSTVNNVSKLFVGARPRDRRSMACCLSLTLGLRNAALDRRNGYQRPFRWPWLMAWFQPAPSQRINAQQNSTMETRPAMPSLSQHKYTQTDSSMHSRMGTHPHTHTHTHTHTHLDVYSRLDVHLHTEDSASNTISKKEKQISTFHNWTFNIAL